MISWIRASHWKKYHFRENRYEHSICFDREKWEVVTRPQWINTVGPSDVHMLQLGHHWFGQYMIYNIMACCMASTKSLPEPWSAPSHGRNQSWHIANRPLWTAVGDIWIKAQLVPCYKIHPKKSPKNVSYFAQASVNSSSLGQNGCHSYRRHFQTHFREWNILCFN